MPTSSEQNETIATWDVPLPNGAQMRLVARPGDVITVVGANGSGKSALATWMATSTPPGALRRIFAQRRLWLQNSGSSMSAADRERHSGNLVHWDRGGASRYVDHVDGQRGDITLFDLFGKMVSENQAVADLVYNENASPDLIAATVGPRLLEVLNSVLARAGIHVSIHITAQQTFVARHRSIDVEYPIAQMSDGERSALLLAADVLTAPGNVIVMIDEPERHLHRSISARLIEALIEERDDCAFIVLTHDLDLALNLSSRPGKTIAALGVEWTSENPVKWDIHEVAADAPIPDAARRAILGGRQKILFVEGKKDSLDIALYGTIFPAWTVVPVGSCDAVIRNVTGLTTSGEHHWIEATGIVDGDGRSFDERKSLESRGVRVLRVSEIENLYYLPNVMAAVAGKQAATLGGEAITLVANAKVKALEVLGREDTLQRLAKKLAKDEVSRQLLAQMPKSVGEDDISITLPSPYARIYQELKTLHGASNYEALVRAVPIRDTDLRNQVSRALHFQNYNSYQKAGLVCILGSEDLADALRQELPDLDASETRTASGEGPAPIAA